MVTTTSDDLIKELAELDLTPQQAKVIALTFTERRRCEIYKKAGISRITYWRWCNNNPAFKRGLEIARREFLKLVAAEVKQMWIDAYAEQAKRLINNGLDSRRPPTPTR